ncbi:EF-hand domain containing protein [Caulobacteraceae bacterium]
MLVRAASLLLFLFATPALAQDLPTPEYTGPISIPGAGAREAPEPLGPPPLQLFISPAGEPFRAEPGEPYPLTRWFSRADTDRDGMLTRAEFVADSLAFFATLDKDGDRVVDGFENADYERDIAPEITGVMPLPDRRSDGQQILPLPPTRAEQAYGQPSILYPRGRPMAPRRQGAAQYSVINEPHPVRGADSDLDHKVTLAEAEAAARMRFALLDTDSDGRLAAVDLGKTPAQAMADAPPRDGGRKKKPKSVEMRLQPAASSSIQIAPPVIEPGYETP